MSQRLNVTKTFKLFIGGAFPRSESGRSMEVNAEDGSIYAHLCHASRKDLRDAVEAAGSAREKWGSASSYLRGQILYRMAEMLEGKAQECAAIIADTTESTLTNARKEVAASIDRLVAFAGWTDKYQQVLGCSNPVSGTYYNFTVPEPTGIVGVIAPDTPSLLGLVSLIAPPLAAGNVVVAIASESSPVAAAMLAEVCATADVLPGTVNLLTGYRDELIGHMAMHREIGAISTANLSKSQAAVVREGVAENIKRVHIQRITDRQWYETDDRHSPWVIEPFVEMKTIWHPSAT
jgi:acyl-CoA reductase-like NAD-dependent aldehyde dehydrogenase